MRPEWIKCITRDRFDMYCGRLRGVAEWTFNDLRHAQLTVESEGRLVPCEQCMKVANEENGHN